MALFNYATKEITLKIVYYGPGLSGKTTNLQYLHSILNPSTTGKLLSLSTEADRTLFFDFLPVELGKIRDFSIRFQLYTVPGQVRYNATRKIVLKGGDAVIFVADSQRDMREQNIDSFDNMMENLHSNNIKPDDIPIVLQYNKRDLSNILSIDDLNDSLNSANKFAVTEAVATKGTGVEETYKLVTRLLLRNIAKKHKVEILPVPEKEEKKETDKTSQAVPARDAAPVTPPQTKPELIRAFSEPQPFPLETSAPPAPQGGISTDEEADVYAIDEEEERGYTAVSGTSVEISPGPAATPDIFPDAPVTMPFMKREASQAAVREKERAYVNEVRELPVFSADKFDEMIQRIEKMTAVLTELRDTITKMSISLSVHEEALKEIGELREIRKEQGEMNTLLKNLFGFLNALKEKKRWFKF